MMKVLKPLVDGIGCEERSDQCLNIESARHRMMMHDAENPHLIMRQGGQGAVVELAKKIPNNLVVTVPSQPLSAGAVRM
jgi:hypothetical protein